MVDRLRLRLVERRASELVAQLQRRQGDRWIQQVVEGVRVLRGRRWDVGEKWWLFSH